MAACPSLAILAQLAAIACIPIAEEDIAACAAATLAAYRAVVVDRVTGGSAAGDMRLAVEGIHLVAEDRHLAVGILVVEVGIGREDTDQAGTFQVSLEDTVRVGTIQEDTGREASSRAVSQGSQVAF